MGGSEHRAKPDRPASRQQQFCRYQWQGWPELEQRKRNDKHCDIAGRLLHDDSDMRRLRGEGRVRLVQKQEWLLSWRRQRAFRGYHLPAS
jgi:hypothetical protein